MNKKNYKNFKVGDRVKVKHRQPGHFGQYIETTDIGTINGFALKVCIKKSDINDNLPYFAYVKFDRTFNIHNNIICGGVNICNLQKVNS